MTISHFGTFDVANYGDCLFPQLLAQVLSKAGDNSGVQRWSPTALAADGLVAGASVSAIRSGSSLRTLAQSTLNILAGGQTLTFDHTSGTYAHLLPWTIPAGLRLWAVPAVVASKFQTPFWVYSVGVDSIPKDREALLRSAFSLASRVAVRDHESASRLSNIGIQAEVLPDIIVALPWALAHEPECFDKADELIRSADIGKDFFVAQASPGYLRGRESDWVEAIATFSKRHDLPVLLLPICEFLNDRELMGVMRQELAQRGVRAAVANGGSDVLLTGATIGKARFVVSSSLHAGLSGAVQGVGCICLSEKRPGKHGPVFSVFGAPEAVVDSPAEMAQVTSLEPTFTKEVIEAKQSQVVDWFRQGLAESLCVPSDADKQVLDQWYAQHHWLELRRCGPLLAAKKMLKAGWRQLSGNYPNGL